MFFTLVKLVRTHELFSPELISYIFPHTFYSFSCSLAWNAVASNAVEMDLRLNDTESEVVDPTSIKEKLNEQ